MTRMTSRGVRSRTAVAITLSAMMAAGACTGGSSSDGSPSETQKLMNSTAPAKGDIPSLTWNLTAGEPDTLDPTNAVTLSGGTVVDNLCDPLLRMNPDFSVEPNLASFEQVTPTQVVFTIRDDAKFWDGAPVTPEDVAYSLNRASEPTRIVSFVFSKVKSIKASGVDKVIVDFKEPDELFTKEMAALGGSIIEKKFTEAAGENFGTPAGGIMCSGPLKLDKWSSGDSITTSRNENYWNQKFRARAATVKYTFITDSTALTQALNAGEIDGAYEISADAIPTLKKSSAGSLRFGPSTQYLTISVARPDGQIADPKLRQALQVLVDREALADVVYHGAATPNYAFVTPTTWEADGKATYEAAYKKLETERAVDPAKAKKLVEESNYDGSKIVLATLAGNAAQNQVAQLVQEQAKAAGVSIVLKPLQPLEFDQAGYDPEKRKGIDLILSSGFNGAQDPVEPIGFSLLPGAFYNYTGLDEPVVTKAIVDIQASFDSQKRADLFVKAQEVYEAKNAFIPLLSTNTVSFVKKDLAGIVTSWAYWSMPSQALIGSAE